MLPLRFSLTSFCSSFSYSNATQFNNTTKCSPHSCVNIAANWICLYLFRGVLVKMTMPHVGAVFATIAGVIAIMLHSSIHKIEEGHLAVYYRYDNTDPQHLWMAYWLDTYFLIMIHNAHTYIWHGNGSKGCWCLGAVNLFKRATRDCY